MLMSQREPTLASAMQVRAATSAETRAATGPIETTASTASISAWAAPKVAGKTHRGGRDKRFTSDQGRRISAFDVWGRIVEWLGCLTPSRRIPGLIPLVSVGLPVWHPDS